MNASDILQFWFKEVTEEQKWKKDPVFDELITEKFSDVYEQARKGETFKWRNTPEGRVAEVIVLDQFPRNMFRESPQAFATDSHALALAQEAISLGIDTNLDTQRKLFLYLPFMHSESKIIHEVAMVLFDQPGLEYNLEFEVKHKEIIDRFGRYPHRNSVLGRVSTEEEIEFLKQPGSSF